MYMYLWPLNLADQWLVGHLTLNFNFIIIAKMNMSQIHAIPALRYHVQYRDIC